MRGTGLCSKHIVSRIMIDDSKIQNNHDSLGIVRNFQVLWRLGVRLQQWDFSFWLDLQRQVKPYQYMVDCIKTYSA